VAKAPPDGYTLLFWGSALWLLPFLRSGVPYDPVKDFAPITLAVNSPNVIIVHPSLAANSVRELIALAKARPGQLNYASGSTGSSNHLAAELFNSMAGINIVRITYKGAGAALNDLIAGQVQVMFPNAAAAAPHIKSGRIRALAVTSLQPSALAPGLPTVAGSGLPGYESGSILSVLAPGRTPIPIINRLNREIVQVLKRPDVKEKFFTTGSEVVASSPDELAAARESDMVKIGKLIKDVGIRE
jgi:tripartite-type tricarboxylate transporter receptor subunit TctC